MKKTQNKNLKAFTLVELIIVITILAILATIAFLSFSSYTAKSKDGAKLTTLKNLQSGLDIFQINTGKYPLPDGTLTAGFIDGNEVAKKGVIGENITSLIKISSLPSDTGASYVYGISQNAKEYQIATVLETDLAQKNSLTQKTLANNYTAKVVGNYKGYLEFQSGSQTYVANIPSLLFTFTGSNVQLLNGNQVFFITDKEKNLPYAVGDVSPNNISGNITVQQLYGDTATLTKIDITDIKAAKTESEKLTAIENLGESIKNFGVSSPEEFLNVAENKPLVITQVAENTGGNTPVSCPENPTSEEFFTFSGGTIIGYSLSGPKDVIIPCKIGGVDVTVIGSSAFGSRGLTSVVIPNTVKTLAFRAFINNSLTQIVIPNSVTDMGATGIFATNQLTSVTLSPSAPIIGTNAFSNNKLTSIIIPQGVTTLSNGSFNNNLLTSVSLPSSLTSIGTNTFLNNVSLTSVTNFDGFASPYIYVPFEDGLKLVGVIGSVSANLTIPSTINSKPIKFIGDYVFYNKGLNAVVIPDSVNIIGTGAFQANLLTSLELPSSVTSLGNNAFANNQLSSVEIPHTVISLGNNAFGSNQLSSVKILNSATSLGNNAFQYQTNAAGFGSISYASEGQKNTYHNATYVDTAKLPYGIVGDDTSSIPTLVCPETPTDAQYFTFNNGTITGYSNDGPKNVIIPCQINGVYVTAIGNDAFMGKGLTSINIPNSVTSIGIMGFYNNQLTSVTIPSSVTSLGDYAFYFNQITSVTIPNSITSIENYTFGSNQLNSVTIPNSVITIGNNAFVSNNLTSVTIPNSVTSIESHAFSYNKLTSVHIPNSVTSIESHAFISQTNSVGGGTVNYASQTQRDTYHNATYIDLEKLPNDVIQP